jgi:hypothetical protein
MTQRIPIIATANQTLSVTLGGQFCKITIIQRNGYVYLSLNANNVDVLNTRMCRDRTALVRGSHLSFRGDLAFIDTRGTSDPDYTGFGVRYQLVYLP